MGLLFRKRVRIIPGVHINFSKSGASLSVGPRGAKVNVGKRGATLHTGVPGTGLYSRQTIVKRTPSNNTKKTAVNADYSKNAPPPLGAMIVAVSFAFAVMVFFDNFKNFWVSIIALLIGIPLGLLVVWFVDLKKFRNH